MKVIQKIFFALTLMMGLSLAVSAQKEDPKKPPPKEKPPVVTPQPKPKPPARGNPAPDKPKKPDHESGLLVRRIEFLDTA